MRLISLLMILGLSLGASGLALAAEDAYVLKLYRAKTGDVVENKQEETGKLNVSFTIGGMEKKDNISNSKKIVFTEEILAKKAEDKHATKLRRTYSVHETTENGETTKASFVGKPILIERKADGYSITVNGKPLPEDEAPELYKKFDSTRDDEPENSDFLPEKAVKVGESWTVPKEKSTKMFESLNQDKMKVDTKKSSIQGKLLKTYEKDGARFGVLEIKFQMFITAMDLGGQELDTTKASVMTVVGTVDTCIDGSVLYEKSKMNVDINVTAEIPNGSISIQSQTQGTELTTPIMK
jgi:hypothetical protein